MKCEVEFLPVGSKSKPGDAIIVRYGEQDDYKLMVVDGGHEETGEKMVSHLKRYFGENVFLTHVVLTHSDADHASGLRKVLREVPIANLWLHIPWLLAEEARQRSLFKEKRYTEGGLRDAIKREYDMIDEIFEWALKTGCKIHYPFEGEDIGPFRVLSPSLYAYIHLLPQFDTTPDPDQAALEAVSMWLGKQSSFVGIRNLLDQAAAKIQKWVDESWESERLRDGGITSASNESSVVLYADCGNNRRVLLTGDAGVNGLTWAADYADSCGFPLQAFSFIQVPHHGSRRNVGPTILNRIVGPIQHENSSSRFTAFVSAPADDDTHPRKMVLNAFIRRGAKVIATQGECKIHYGGFPKRDGYVNTTPLAFSRQVEDYD